MDFIREFIEKYNNFYQKNNVNFEKNDLIENYINKEPDKTNYDKINKCEELEKEFFTCYDKNGFYNCFDLYNKHLFCHNQNKK